MKDVSKFEKINTTLDLSDLKKVLDKMVKETEAEELNRLLKEFDEGHRALKYKKKRIAELQRKLKK